MRRSTRLAEKKANFENETQREPKAKKSRSDDNIPIIAAMDNGTMVETFKFLNYCQLATRSLVSKRFWNLIRTHRHKLTLLDVVEISMRKELFYDWTFKTHRSAVFYDRTFKRTERIGYVSNQDPAAIELFDKVLSPNEYDEWIARNGYSKQIPLKGRVAAKESTVNGRKIYVLRADIYQNTHNYHHDTAVYYAKVELKDEICPLFQHFVRLLVDPFIYIRFLSLNPQKGVFSFLAGAMNEGCDRLQCKQLIICFTGDTQKFIGWIKDHVCCDELEIDVDSHFNYDEELVDLFLTGAPCTSAILVINNIFSEDIVDLVQKEVFCHCLYEPSKLRTLNKGECRIWCPSNSNRNQGQRKDSRIESTQGKSRKEEQAKLHLPAIHLANLLSTSR